MRKSYGAFGHERRLHALVKGSTSEMASVAQNLRNRKLQITNHVCSGKKGGETFSTFKMELQMFNIRSRWCKKTNTHQQLKILEANSPIVASYLVHRPLALQGLQFPAIFSSRATVCRNCQLWSDSPTSQPWGSTKQVHQSHPCGSVAFE